MLLFPSYGSLLISLEKSHPLICGRRFSRLFFSRSFVVLGISLGLAERGLWATTLLSTFWVTFWMVTAPSSPSSHVFFSLLICKNIWPHLLLSFTCGQRVGVEYPILKNHPLLGNCFKMHYFLSYKIPPILHFFPIASCGVTISMTFFGVTYSTESLF